MQIKITTTLDISEENKGLLPIVLADIGYEAWKEKKMSDSKEESFKSQREEYIKNVDMSKEEPMPELIFDESSVDVSTDTFIKFFLSENNKKGLKQMISASVTSYFGGVMKGNAEAVNSALEEAISSNVEIKQ